MPSSNTTVPSPSKPRFAQAAATVTTLPTPIASRLTPPTVLIDGELITHAHPIRFTATAPLDERTALLEIDHTTAPPIQRIETAPHTVSLLDSHRLSDHTLRKPVLAHGRIESLPKTQKDATSQHRWQLTDDWSTRLDRPLDQITQLVNGVIIPANPADAALDIGSNANRADTSTDPQSAPPLQTLAGRGTPQTDWTITDALQAVSTWGELNLLTHTLLPAIAAARLPRRITLDRPLRDILTALLDPFDLILRRDITRNRDDGKNRETRQVIHREHARQIALNFQSLGGVSEIKNQPLTPTARHTKVRAEGPITEATFTLSAGWDPALAGQSPATYSRLTNTNFTEVANVYRRFVLNEDAAFSIYGVPSFDLAEFFNEPATPARPLRFLPNLTLDAGGDRRPVIVDVSYNSGSTWLRAPGSINILSNRAGILFDDTTLDPDFLTAALADTLRLRVTASLQSPTKTEVARWHGNPFHGTAPTRIIETNDTFRFRRIDKTSTHHDAVRAQTLQADEANDLAAMTQWTIEAADQTPRNTKLSRLTLPGFSGAWPVIKPGDHLFDTSRPLPADDSTTPLLLPWHERGGSVTRVDIRYENPPQIHIDATL